MQPDKKQIAQFVVLGVLVVVCIAYVSFKVMGSKAPGAANNPAKNAGAVTALTADSSATVTQDQSPTGVFPDLNSPPAKRDPFTVQKLPQSEDQQSSDQQLIEARPQPVVVNAGAKLPRIEVAPLNPFAKTNATVSVSKDNQEPQFTLTGVLRGESNVVILRSGTNERHIVKQGQFINGRYKVLFVTGDGAVLADKNHRIHLKLGGNKNAS
jgi:hypothetical protein